MADNNATPDLASIMAQVANLEKQNQELQNNLQNKNNRLEKLTESKRTEMQNVLDNVITKWLDTVETQNPESKEQFKTGLNKLVDNTAEDSGIWQVVACASSAHMRTVNELEQMRTDYNALKEKMEGGQFARTEDQIQVGNKRRATESIDPEEPERRDIWGDFELMMKTTNL